MIRPGQGSDGAKAMADTQVGRDADEATPLLRTRGVRRSLLIGTLTLLAGTAAVHVLSRPSARPQAAVAALADPLTTGSIGGAAGATRLDPCELLRPRQP